MKEKILKERGITLIALVITIIVLLILAGVTISIVLHTGIIDNSQKAVDQYAYEQQREEEALKSLSGYMHSYSNVVPIYTAEQLKQVGKGGKVNIEQENTEFEFSMNANYVLMADIDLNPGKWSEEKDKEEKGITYSFNADAEQWTPIGTIDEPFTGTFNGNGHTISGIYINESDKDYQGFFGVIEDSTIENLTVSGSIIGKGGLGGITGLTIGKSKINNCNNLCKITGKNVIGGITGQIKNGNVIISNCSNKRKLNATAEWSGLGGIVGTTNGGEETPNKEITITNCYNEGIITGEGSDVGGIVGEEKTPENALIEKCYNIGDINGTDYVAGIVGFVWYKCTIRACYNEGDIKGTNAYIGGISGTGYVIELCYNSGNITSEEKYAAGITTACENNNGGTVRNSYNTGDIKGKTGAGGILVRIGQRGTIENCYNTGTVTRTDTNESGSGIIDNVNGKGKTTNCYYLEGTASSGIKEIEDEIGQAEEKSETDMKNNTEFVKTLNNGENNWKEDKEGKAAINEGYPILSWQ